MKPDIQLLLLMTNSKNVRKKNGLGANCLFRKWMPWVGKHARPWLKDWWKRGWILNTLVMKMTFYSWTGTCLSWICGTLRLPMKYTWRVIVCRKNIKAGGCPLERVKPFISLISWQPIRKQESRSGIYLQNTSVFGMNREWYSVWGTGQTGVPW